MPNQLYSPKFKLTFKGGKTAIVSEESAHYLDQVFDKFQTEKWDRLVTLPDGSKILISRLIAIDPYNQQELFEEQRNLNTFEYLQQITERAKIDTPKKQKMIDMIRENFKRKNRVEHWIYFDNECREISKESAKLLTIRET